MDGGSYAPGRTWLSSWNGRTQAVGFKITSFLPLDKHEARCNEVSLLESSCHSDESVGGKSRIVIKTSDTVFKESRVSMYVFIVLCTFERTN